MKPNKQIKKLWKKRYKFLIEQINKNIISIKRKEIAPIDFDILRPYFNKVISNNETIIFYRKGV